MGEQVEEKKLSYEELKAVAGQLQQQNTFMREQLLKARNEEMFKRVDYLFKVIENKNVFNETFYGKVVDELQLILTIPEQEEVKE